MSIAPWCESCFTFIAVAEQDVFSVDCSHGDLLWISTSAQTTTFSPLWILPSLGVLLACYRISYSRVTCGTTKLVKCPCSTFSHGLHGVRTDLSLRKILFCSHKWGMSLETYTVLLSPVANKCLSFIILICETFWSHLTLFGGSQKRIPPT